MKNCEEVLRNLNWTLPREQKDYCLNERDNNADATEIYSGLVHLVDHLQDVAVKDGIATEEEEVFGEIK